MTTTDPQADPRAVRSRRMLRSALLELLLEKPFSHIRTKEIAERAEMNRATFYVHYADREELLKELVDEVMCEYADIIEEVPGVTATQISEAGLIRAIRLTIGHIRKHEAFYRMMLLTDNVPGLSNRLHDQMRHSFRKSLFPSVEKYAGIEIDLYIDWIIGGAVGAYKHWLQRGMKQTDDEIADQLLRIMSAAGQAFHTGAAVRDRGTGGL